MYCWKIDTDHTSLMEGEPDVREGIRGNPGARLIGMPVSHFKLYDDDDDLYYSGRFWGDEDSEEAFAPLDWGSRYAGCTRIDYRQEDGTWVIL